MPTPKSRINFEVDDELKGRFEQWPWGVRSNVMRTLLEFACDLYDRHGELAIGAILARDFHFESARIRSVSKADTP